MESNDVVDILQRYSEGQLCSDLKPSLIPLKEVDSILVTGATGLLRGVKQGLTNELKNYFRNDVQVLGTVGSPMQCMLKGVCAQCLQWQIDPDTGERTRAVFSCATQDQPLFWIDLDNMTARMRQNCPSDRLTGQWVNHLLSS